MTTESSGAQRAGSELASTSTTPTTRWQECSTLLSQFDESARHQPGLDELPFVCGDLLSGGLESNDQRDVVIDASWRRVSTVHMLV